MNFKLLAIILLFTLLAVPVLAQSATPSNSIIDVGNVKCKGKVGDGCRLIDNGYIIVKDDNLKPGKSFTFSIWVKPYDNGLKRLFFARDRNKFGIMFNQKTIQTSINGRMYTIPLSNAQVLPNEWTHLSFAYDGSKRNMAYYVNGKQIKVQAIPLLRLDGEGIIGAEMSYRCSTPYWYMPWKKSCDNFISAGFNGEIDGLKIYDRPLTISQVKEIMHSKVDSAQILNDFLKGIDAINSDTITTNGFFTCTAPATLITQELRAVDTVIELSKGWNLAAFPVKNRLSASKLIPGSCASEVWTLEEGKFVKADKVEAGRGYWINVGADCKISLEKSSLADRVEITLKPGWNLVGGLSGNRAYVKGAEGFAWKWHSEFQKATDVRPTDGLLLKFNPRYGECPQPPARGGARSDPSVISELRSSTDIDVKPDIDERHVRMPNGALARPPVLNEKAD